jgi:anti-anti-sigma regulatory factor
VRLNLDGSTVPPGTAVLAVSGIIDWSTINQFRVALSHYVSRPRPDLLLDLTGLLSWSAEAQLILAHATVEARLHGGRIVVLGLAPIPSWQATGSGLPDLGLALITERRRHQT